MNDYVICATVAVQISSNLSIEEAKEEFEQNAMYNLEDTENVTVIETNWRDSTIKNYPVKD